MPRRSPQRSVYAAYVQRKPRPLPAGKVVARCSLCRGEGKADGKGTPVTIKHARNCPEHPLNGDNT